MALNPGIADSLPECIVSFLPEKQNFGTATTQVEADRIRQVLWSETFRVNYAETSGFVTVRAVKRRHDAGEAITWRLHGEHAMGGSVAPDQWQLWAPVVTWTAGVPLHNIDVMTVLHNVGCRLNADDFKHLPKLHSDVLTIDQPRLT